MYVEIKAIWSFFNIIFILVQIYHYEMINNIIFELIKREKKSLKYSSNMLMEQNKFKLN